MQVELLQNQECLKLGQSSYWAHRWVEQMSLHQLFQDGRLCHHACGSWEWPHCLTSRATSILRLCVSSQPRSQLVISVFLLALPRTFAASTYSVDPAKASCSGGRSAKPSDHHPEGVPRYASSFPCPLLAALGFVASPTPRLPISLF